MAANLKQAELAAMVNATQSHISGMERGTRAPSIEMLEGLATALGVSAHWLMGGDEPTKHQDLGFGREHILADRGSATGLVTLAGDVVFCDRLRITSTEWRCLHSLRSPQGLSREGYVAVLLAFRGFPAT